MIRRKLIAAWMILMFILMINLPTESTPHAQDLYYYLTNNFYQDTAAGNAVAGIYLDYRVFDTLFETLLLLVSVIGIIYFSRHEGDY